MLNLFTQTNRRLKDIGYLGDVHNWNQIVHWFILKADCLPYVILLPKGFKGCMHVRNNFIISTVMSNQKSIGYAHAQDKAINLCIDYYIDKNNLNIPVA